MSKKSKGKHNHPTASPHQERGEEKTTNRHVYIEPGVQIDIVQDLKQKYETSNTNNATHNRKILFWTKVGSGLIFIYASVATWQGCLMRQTLITAQRANEITKESIRAKVVLADMDFINPVVAGKKIGIKFNIRNIGRSPATYGVSAEMHRWSEMPDGEMPLAVTDVSKPIFPDTPTTASQAAIEPQPATQEYIDSIPSMGSLMTDKSPGYHQVGPPHHDDSYFIAKLVYDTLGERWEQQACFFLVRADENTRAAGFPDAEITQGYIFYLCPKWTITRKFPIPSSH